MWKGVRNLISNQQVDFTDKYLGALLGAMIGDALGWAYEDRGMNISNNQVFQKNFIKWNRKCGGRFYLHEEEILPGSYSDDTQLILATARSLQYRNWYSHFVRTELPAWIMYERGGGGATKRAAESWSHGRPPWKLDKAKSEGVIRYFKAGGNGVAMRILPHVFYCKGNLEELSRQVFLNGIATHGHPRAILSAIVYAWALHYLLEKETILEYGELISYLIENKGRWEKFPSVQNIKDWLDSSEYAFRGSYFDDWAKTASEIHEGLSISYQSVKKGLLDYSYDTLEKLNCFNKDIRGAGTVATLVSIYMASKHAADPSTGIMELASMKNADTDTNASMAGALLGTIHGTQWIPPEWSLVQDYNYARKIVSEFGKDVRDNSNEKYWLSTYNDRLRETLPLLKRDEELSFGPFESIKLMDTINNKTYSNKLEVTTYKFISIEGQSLYIKLIKKNEPVQNGLKTTNDKKIELVNKKVVLTADDFQFLSNLFAPRITASKVFSIISSIIKDLQDEQYINDQKVIQSIVRKHSQKNISEETIRELIHFINGKSNF